MNVELSSVCKRIGLLVGASFLSGVCYAQDAGPKYTYIEGGYTAIDIDDFDEDGDLWGVGGSLALTDMLFLSGGFASGDVGDVDLTQAFVGLGLNVALNDTTDFVAEAGVAYAEVEFGPFDEDDEGLGLSAGVRSMITPQFELNGGISYVDIADDDETALYAGAVYSFTDMFAGTLGVSFGDDATSYGIGVRLYFN
jgi:hypothetical protein